MDVSEVMKVLLRSLEAAIGIAMCWTAFFLYEGEERRLQSKLEDLWIVVDDLKEHANPILQFVRGCAGLTRQTLDCLFGPKIISTQSIGVSLCFIFSSLLFTLLSFSTKNFTSEVTNPDFVLGIQAGAAVFFIAGCAPAFFGRRWAMVVAFWLPVLPIIIVLLITLMLGLIAPASALTACSSDGTTTVCSSAAPGAFNGLIVKLGAGSIVSVGVALLLDFVWISINRRIFILTSTTRQVSILLLGITTFAAMSMMLFTKF